MMTSVFLVARSGLPLELRCHLSTLQRIKMNITIQRILHGIVTDNQSRGAFRKTRDFIFRYFYLTWYGKRALDTAYYFLSALIPFKPRPVWTLKLAAA